MKIYNFHLFRPKISYTKSNPGKMIISNIWVSTINATSTIYTNPLIKFEKKNQPTLNVEIEFFLKNGFLFCSYIDWVVLELFIRHHEDTGEHHYIKWHHYLLNDNSHWQLSSRNPLSTLWSPPKNPIRRTKEKKSFSWEVHYKINRRKKKL